MKRIHQKGESVRAYILKNVDKFPSDICKKTTEKFAISRQAVNKHLQNLVEEKALIEEGNTRSKKYGLSSLVEWSHTYKIDANLAEDLVWREAISPQLGELPGNVKNIWHHGFTEMFNNAIDHSSSESIHIHVKKDAMATEILVMDDGIGIFRKIQAAFNLLDERHAILELAKGKLTTDPKRHSGEGIFFSSRMFDEFDILSGGVYFSHEFGKASDWILERAKPSSGTAVWMKLSNHTSRTTAKVFDQFASGANDYGFTKTVVPVELARYGDDNLISRSQAKRLLARVELFKTVMFDFKGVPTIGQAFADEIFRVFPIQHPDIELLTLNATPEVERMIERAKAS